VNSLAYFSISAIWSVDCFSLHSRTFVGVVGLKFSLRSSISFLYPSIVCEIIFIFSSAFLSHSCMLFRMWSYTIVIPCSILLAHYLSSSFFEFIWLQVIFKISVTPLPTSNLVAFARALDCIYCIMFS
jgi:hypothetical protein